MLTYFKITFRQCKFYADIRGGSRVRRRRTTVGGRKAAIFSRFLLASSW